MRRNVRRRRIPTLKGGLGGETLPLRAFRSPSPGFSLGTMTRALSFVFLLVPAVAGAQGVSLQYHPVAGTRLQTISEGRMTAVWFGLPSLPDSSVTESDWRTVRTARVTEMIGDKRKVHVTLNSSRARARTGSNPRVDVALPGAQGLALDALVGWKLDIQSATPTERGADSSFVAALRAGLGGLEFQFADGPITKGFNWGSPLQFPLGAHLTAGGKLSAVESMRGTATVILDSVTARGSDTLAFLTLSGVLDAKTMVVAGEGGMGTGMVTGRIAAVLVWSSGWNAMVSAVMNARFEMKLHLERSEGGPVDGSVSLSISGRHQVRL